MIKVCGMVPFEILTLLCIFLTILDTVYVAAYDPNALTRDELYEKYGLTNPFKPTKEELKYQKRRRNLNKRYDIDIDGFLERYGYLRTVPEVLRTRKIQVHSKIERKHAIREFQEFNGIKTTGKLNKKTVKIMKEPRCGLPDTRTDDPYSPIREFHFYKYYPRWRRSVLTWKATRYTKKISPLAQWKTLKKAFETWSSVSGLRFLYTRQNPDIQIDFEHGNHGDGSKKAFDEKGGVVAHAFGPGSYTISGNVHLDRDEDWTQSVNPKDGINLLAVAIHEIGHALGLHHSNDPRSVMFPAFVRTNLDLSIDDIENIQILYGANPESKLDPYPYLRKPTTEAPKLCKVAMDDIELGPDGYAYIFHNSHIRRIDKRGNPVKTKDKVNIWEVYKNGPPRVDAVAFRAERKKTYMFYNNTLWRYTNFDLDYGYPKNISSMPDKPHCAAFIRDQAGITRLLLFGEDLFWEWSTARNAVVKGYPFSTSKYFEGLPTSPTASIRWTDGYIYFFKKEKYYKVHPMSYNVISGYPQLMPPTWLSGVC